MTDHYSYRVSWSDEDQEYVGSCAEFPSLSHLAENRADALRGIEQLVSSVVQEMTRDGEAIPAPIAERSFSGTFQTRIPPELHRRLTLEAAEAGVSLNRLVSLRLATPVVTGSILKPKGRVKEVA